jgi:alkanesulfonate monooxygenase SsuD/methylene tetrahydromethanopterin reductase-like flavin-dependent oxidoreductase (luciferase family)
MCHDLITQLDNTNFTHLFVPELWGHDAFTQLAAMASVTSELTLGTGIVNLYSRSPATLAQSAASLYELTEERFILGLGLSGPIVIQDWHGINYYQPSPMQRTREYLEILRLIFSGEQVNYDSGKIHSLNGFKLTGFETPLKIPLYLAALGERNLQLAGELADGWFPIWIPFSELPNIKVNLVKGMNRRKDEITENVEIAPFIITCASNTVKAKNLVQKHIAYYVGGMGTFYYAFMKRCGFETEAEKIRRAWQGNDREAAAKAVSDNMLDQIAVTGTPDQVAKRYEEIRKLGINLPIVMLPYNCPPELAMDTIGALAN